MLVLALEARYLYFQVLKSINLIFTKFSKCFSTSDEVFKKIMEVNYFGLIRLTNEMVKHMIDETKKGCNSKAKPQQSIVMIGSVQSLLSIPYRSACKLKSFVYLIILIIIISKIQHQSMHYWHIQMR